MKVSILIIMVPFLSLIASARQKQPALPQANNSFIVISHRGNHLQVPENTVASVQEAIHAGADYVEIDLRTTRDGYLVIHHDASVDRMTNGKGNVKDLTLQEIRSLKVTNNNKSDTTTYHIPEFSEILKACGRNINIYLDFKEADAGETYRQIKKAGMEKRIVVYINKEIQYPAWRRVAPDIPLMSSLPDSIRTKEQLQFFLNRVPLAIVDNLYDSSMVVEARKLGVSVWLDVESPAENPAIWDKAINKGIQGMQTDHPAQLINYLIKNGRRDGRKRNSHL
jgi:glycerophosphoryl diester phosphodiesterase